jgi:nucleoside-diphosphate-sugar epimerase
MMVFLTGGSGYIGSVVAEKLKAAGHELSGLARSDASAARLTAAGVLPIRGDFSDAARVGSAARDADAVISMATTYDPKIDGPAIEAILDALAGSNKPFIYTSGIWINGENGGRVFDESTPPEPAELVKWRLPVENHVREAAGRGIRTVVFRPAIVYGRGAGIPAGLVESARKEGAARYVGTGENRWPLVHVDDLADLYVLALGKAPAGSLFLAVSGASLRVRDVAAAASRAAGQEGRTMAWLLSEAREKMGPYADALALDQQASGKKAEEELGWRPHRPSLIEDLERGSYR